MITKNGFTLVEIMIVVTIIGILAAIIGPMYSNASYQSQVSALNNDLRKIRGQIELYKFQHEGHLPAFSGETSSDFWRRMTTGTDIKGSAGTLFGPYINTVLKNPLNGKNTVRIDGDAAGANTDGWRFDTSTGTFQTDDSVENAVF